MPFSSSTDNILLTTLNFKGTALTVKGKPFRIQGKIRLNVYK